jgi:hypothetical protein
MTDPALGPGSIAALRGAIFRGSEPPPEIPPIEAKRRQAMAKAYKRLRRQRTERRLKNQSFMEPSKRPLQGRRKKSFIRSLLASP